MVNRKQLLALLGVSLASAAINLTLPEAARSQGTGESASLLKPLKGIGGPTVVEEDSTTNPRQLPSAPALAAKPPAAQAGAASGSLKGYARKLKLNSGLRAISQSASRIQRTSLDMMGELTRFNLLWGEPPNDYNPEMFFGGGFTREQVLEQFRRLPTTVFTTPGYVQLFSYRQAPRKRFLVEYTRQLGKLINSMWSDISATELPADKQAALAEQWTDLMLLARDVQNNYMTIYTLLETTPSDRLKKNIIEQQRNFGAPLVAIYDGLTKMNAAINEIRTLARQ
jgi:hypothetical protein